MVRTAGGSPGTGRQETNEDGMMFGMNITPAIISHSSVSPWPIVELQVIDTPSAKTWALPVRFTTVSLVQPEYPMVGHCAQFNTSGVAATGEPVKAPKVVELTGIVKVSAPVTVIVKVPLIGVQFPVAPEITTTVPVICP